MRDESRNVHSIQIVSLLSISFLKSLEGDR